MSEERHRINKLGTELLALLGPGDRSITLYPGDANAPDGSINATVTNGLCVAEGHAIGLYDALHMARRHVEVESARLLAEAKG